VLDTHGRPVVGATVTFALPQAAGAGAAFVGGTNQATAATNVRGAAASPPMIANDSPGRFDATATTNGVTAPVTFQLHNLAPRLTAVAKAETATVDQRYPRPLRARALDSYGRPVEGITVTFMLPQTAAGAGAAFLGGGTQATATTDAQGRASSPALVANSSAGRFTAAATIAAQPTPITFALRNVAGAPATVTAGAASGESTATGSRFAVPLAVTVRDKNGNPVQGALVTFTAPTGGGPSGHFTIANTRHRAHASHVARARTNANGVAVAPPFTANTQAGGYALTARAGRTRAGFALVNTQR
jgi:protocatechuate 3,4-dioxygenase beta subunit